VPRLIRNAPGLMKFDEQYPIYNWIHPLRGEELGAVPLDEVLAQVDASVTTERSLYFHIPFCDTICTFCTLNRGLGSEGDAALETYTRALIREIELKAHAPGIACVPPSSIFFGGGSPSVLSADQLQRICAAIREHFDLSQLVEWTFEMEVKSVTEEKCAVLAAAGVNRSRFGIQSFDPKFRSLFNITATFDQTQQAIEAAGRHFESRGIDMIYGMHGQTLTEFTRDIQSLIGAGTETIDCYPITNIATQGSLHHGYARQGLRPTPYIDKMVMTLYLNQFMAAAGFKRHNGHGFVRLGTRPQEPSGTSRAFRNYYNTTAMFSHHDADVVGFGSSAISQVGRHVLQNDVNRESYVRGLLDRKELSVKVTKNSHVPWDRGLVHYLPYAGQADKSRIPWEHIEPETIEKLAILTEEGLLEETPTEYRTTELGWAWYVNLMYYLSSAEDQEALDAVATVRGRSGALTDGDRRMIPLAVAS
jgi:coproporphyrinogen III oxidase-like Fe-S oxidoreductase